MIFYWALLGALGFLAYASTAQANSGDGTMGIVIKGTHGLLDVDPANQGGSYNRAYDDAFEAASGESGVPFALIKAHAIRESSLVPTAYHYDNPSSGASYGLMQVEWGGSKTMGRFEKYGVSDDQIGDGSGLYEPFANARLGALIIRDNLAWLKGNLRDAINAYNTGTTESKHAAPANYVNDVLKYYNELVGGGVV